MLTFHSDCQMTADFKEWYMVSLHPFVVTSIQWHTPLCPFGAPRTGRRYHLPLSTAVEVPVVAYACPLESLGNGPGHIKWRIHTFGTDYAGSIMYITDNIQGSSRRISDLPWDLSLIDTGGVRPFLLLFPHTRRHSQDHECWGVATKTSLRAY